MINMFGYDESFEKLTSPTVFHSPPQMFCNDENCDCSLPAAHVCYVGCEHDPGEGHNPVTGHASND